MDRGFPSRPPPPRRACQLTSIETLSASTPRSRTALCAATTTSTYIQHRQGQTSEAITRSRIEEQTRAPKLRASSSCRAAGIRPPRNTRLEALDLPWSPANNAQLDLPPTRDTTECPGARTASAQIDVNSCLYLEPSRIESRTSRTSLQAVQAGTVRGE